MRYSAISGQVWSLDGTENGVSNIPVTLLDASGKAVGARLTGSDGAYAITGGIPALFTEDDGTQTPVRIVVQFTDEDPYGSVLGVVTTQVFSEEEGVTFGKLIPIDDESVAGHTVNFICDYYYADGTFENNYLFGEETTLSADMEISNVALDHPENCRATYRITDLYNNYYWTPAM